MSTKPSARAETKRFTTESPGKKSQRSMLPKLRNQKSGAKQTIISQKSEAQTPATTSEHVKPERNKTPVQVPHPVKKPTQQMNFPQLMNDGLALNPVEFEKKNFILDLDSQLYSTRQNRHHLGAFYRRVVNNRILQTMSPSSCLASESIALANLTTRMSLVKKLEKGGMSTRNANMMSRTLANLNDATPENEGDLTMESKNINDQSAMEHYQGITNTTSRQPFNIDSVDKPMILPSIAHFQSDDSLFGESKTQLGGESKMQGKQQVSGEPTGFTMNATEMTAPHSSKQTNIQFATTQLESILLDSQILDPLAGSSIISHLNTSLRVDAKDKINEVVQRSTRKRSQQRRRIELVGLKAATRQPMEFIQKGSLEEVYSQSSVCRTATDSMADSAIYQEIVKDYEGFNKFYEREIEPQYQQQKLDEDASNRMSSDLQQQEASIAAQKKEDEVQQLKTMRRDPEAHYKKLKANIKLKSVKKFAEDVVRKEKEAARKASPETVIKDKFGRVIKRESVSGKKKPSKNRPPVTRTPPKLRQSFTECQMKYYGAGDLFNPMSEMKQPTLTDQYIIGFMNQVDRFPIPETLIRPQPEKSFHLVIDSLINDAYRLETVEAWADYKPANGAPYNSLESEDDYFIEESEDSEDPNAVPYITKKLVKEDPTLKEKQFDMRVLLTTPFRLESMKYFPYRSREGEVPYKLLQVPKLKYIFDCLPKIEAQQKEAPFSTELIQNIFEYYCQECKAAPVKLVNFYNYDDPNNHKLSFRNMQLDEQQVKALSLVLPYIHDITEIDLNNNQLTDVTASALALGCFMNPTLKRITVAYNYIRSTFCETLSRLIAQKPEKLTDINLMGSILFHDHIDPVIKVLVKMNNLTYLNIAGCALSQSSCRQLSLFIFKCFALRHLDVSHCRVTYQGTRYIVDALNRNTCIRNFNFAHNNLNSPSYEFSIKISSILTRHPCLLHLDISNTNLKREEVMFIGLSIPTSKTLLSIHITASKLPYYERIFLRAVINARVSFQRKNTANKLDIVGNKEKNTVLTMAQGEVQEDPMHMFIDRFRILDEKVADLDVEIADMLAEVDTEATYEGLNSEEAEVKDLPADSKVAQLVEKMINRQKELEAQQEELQRIYALEKAKVTEQCEALQGLDDIGMEAFAEAGNPAGQQNKRRDSADEDMFAKMRELRVDRHKQRAEREVMRENKDRSAGELALMFMGINQVAYDALMENPMTGYMHEAIFTRILGHEDIEEGSYWTDSTQCWICHKWDKVTLAYNVDADKEIFRQKVTQIENLQVIINKSVHDRLELDKLQKDIETVERIDNQSDDDSLFQDDEKPAKLHVKNTKPWRKRPPKRNDRMAKTGTQFGVGQTPKAKQDDQRFNNTLSGNVLAGGLKKQQTTIREQKPKHKIWHKDQATEGGNCIVDEANLGLDQRTEPLLTEVSMPVDQPHQSQFDTTNIIAPMQLTKDALKKLIYPQGFTEMAKISYHMPTQEEIYGKQWRNLIQLEQKYHDNEQKFSGIQTRKNRMQIKPLHCKEGIDEKFIKQNSLNLHRHYMGSKQGGGSSDGAFLQSMTSVISHTEQKRRRRGEPVIIERHIFFEGVVYQIQEELYSDSDHSSVYTSEDEFTVEKNLPKRFKEKNKQVSDLASSMATQKGMMKYFSTGKQDMDRFLGDASPMSPPVISEQEGYQQVSFMTSAANEQLKHQSVDVGVNLQTADGEPTGSKQTSSKEPLSPTEKVNVVKKAPAPATNRKKTFSKDKQAFAQEQFVNSEGLNDRQKDYEPKTVPKFYKPDLCEKRIKHFAEKYENKAYAEAAEYLQKEPEKRVMSLGESEPAEFKPNEKEIFCIASYNDWMPQRMKTLRALNIEKFSLDTKEDDVPRKVQTLDNSVFLSSSMVPAGVHYFYFVQDKGQIFLSPNYEVVRFKSTNIFLNRIEVSRRLVDIETVHIAKGVDDVEPVFMKDRSVFKDYREDTQAFLQKCFNEDFSFSKITRLVKKGNDFDHEVARIKELLFEHYIRIINIFYFYSGSSSYPFITMNDFTSFSHATKILDGEIIKLADLDLILVASCVSHHQYVNSATLDMTRYEFIEMIVRVAQDRYRLTKVCRTLCEGIEKTLEDLIYPHAKQMDGEHFRRYHCYNIKTNEILKKNEAQIRRIYDSFTHAKKKFVTMPECQAFVRKVGLSISEMMVGAIYAESMMTIIDTIRDLTRPNQMKYVEFIVFLCRISYEHYAKTEHTAELLYLKLDHLMPAFLAYLSLQPQFLFGEKFKSEILEQERSAKRQRMRLRKALKQSKATGIPLDAKTVAEIKAYEAAAMRAAGQFGTFKGNQLGVILLDSSSEEEEESKDQALQMTPKDDESQLDRELGTREDGEQPKSLEHNADLAAVVNTAGASSGIGDVQNEMVLEEDDEEEEKSDQNIDQQLQAIGSHNKDDQ